MTHPSARRWRGFKPWLIWLVFVAVGPLFGLLSSLLAGYLMDLATGRWRFNWNLHPWREVVKSAHMLIFAYPFALLFGGLQGAFVGWVAVRSYALVGKVSLFEVLLASAATWVAFVILLATRESKPVPWEGIFAWALPHFAAGFGCWLLVARLRNSEPMRS